MPLLHGPFLAGNTPLVYICNSPHRQVKTLALSLPLLTPPSNLSGTIIYLQMARQNIISSSTSISYLSS
jgi:hypothetical protein